MKKLLAFVCLSFMFAVPVFAGAQQNGTVSCSEEARENGLKGDDRKAFMKDCHLRKKTEAQSKQKFNTKYCRQTAKEKRLKGDERKQFMSMCMKN